MSGSTTADIGPLELAALATALLDAFESGFDADDADDLAVRLIGLGYTVAPVNAQAEAASAAEQRLRTAVEEAESDAPEEARRFAPPFEGGFREGARWALNRWRSAILEPSSERPTVTPVSEMFEPNAKPRTGPKPDLWGNPNRAARMRSGAPHGDWFVVSGLCKTCGEPYPCVASEEPLPTQASDSPEKP